MLWNLEGRKVYVTRKGYRMVLLPEHPRAHHGTLFLHRVLVENAIGRVLDYGEIVHHKNEDKADNRLDNLEITTHPEHARHHAMQRPRLGETLVSLTCETCGGDFEREQRNAKKYDHVYCSLGCAARAPRSYARIVDGVIRMVSAAPCGTQGAYRKGCRCAACRASNAARQRSYQEGKRCRSSTP